MIRCRYSALYTNVYPIPVFSPQDTIQPVTKGAYADYMWVDMGVAETHRDLMASFCYSGPRWYFRPWVEFMLDRKLITWGHVLWGLTATTHLPADVFKAPFDDRIQGSLKAQHGLARYVTSKVINQIAHWLRSVPRR